MVLLLKHQNISLQNLVVRATVVCGNEDQVGSDMKGGLFMTKNQIEYWNSQYLKQHNERLDAENKRSNLARELETSRSNRAKEVQALRELLELTRSNQARERETNRANMANEKELNRAHRSSEALTRQQNLERTRSAMASESIGRAQQYVSRSGQLLGYLTSSEANRVSRSNALLNAQMSRLSINQRAREARLNFQIQDYRNRLSTQQLAVDRYRANTTYELGLRNADIAHQRYLEDKRHNEVSEYINAFGTALRAGIISKGVLK